VRTRVKEIVVRFVFFMDILYKGPDFEASYSDFSMFSTVGNNGDSKLRRISEENERRRLQHAF
jgi:hypothetical protein